MDIMCDRQTDRFAAGDPSAAKGCVGSVCRCVVGILCLRFFLRAGDNHGSDLRSSALGARKGLALPGTGAQLHLPAPCVPQDFSVLCDAAGMPGPEIAAGSPLQLQVLVFGVTLALLNCCDKQSASVLPRS